MKRAFFDAELATFVDVQSTLLRVLAERVQLGAEFFNDLEPGSISIGEDAWTYHGHGRGITFARTGVVVNVDVAPSADDVFDAWRLAVYLESRGLASVLHNGREYSVEEGDIAAILEDLVASGVLMRRVAKGVETTRLYSFAARRLGV